MAARDLPLQQSLVGPTLPAVVLLVGDEELLVSRAAAEVIAAAHRVDAGAEITERLGGMLEAGELPELLGASLFGDRRVLVLRSAQDIRSAVLPALLPFLTDPTDGVTIILAHAGGAKGKAVLDAARKVGAVEAACARLTRPEERHDFVRAEVRRAGGAITPDAVGLLVEAVGADLRELAAVSAQLVSDCGGRIDGDSVAAYHRGRAEVTGFAVSDLAVAGEQGRALETLRWALSVGVPHVLIADAMADGVRTVARVWAAGRGDPFKLAGTLGMPPWKVRRAQSETRAWSEVGLRRALCVVATLNADVKGAAADPGWALELAIARLATARAER